MLQKSSMEKTIAVFFQTPTKAHYLLDISRNIEIAHTSIKHNIDCLMKAGLIFETIEKKGQRKFPLYTANRDAKKFKTAKVLYNLKSVQESGIIEYLEEKLAPKVIVLFGSYRRGEDVESSDIDLFVECKEEQINITKYEKIFAKKIQFHFKENFLTYPKELKNNIINGIVMSGFLEVYK
ncbi:MAG: nucleotidyltransferase domain-containing protein [Candidatus Woesearchaeota archaeon]|jgi:predicted nucleotidyltransferase